MNHSEYIQGNDKIVKLQIFIQIFFYVHNTDNGHFQLFNSNDRHKY